MRTHHLAMLGLLLSATACGRGAVDPATAQQQPATRSPTGSPTESPTGSADRSADGSEQAPDHPYGFSTWHRDFPGAPDRPHLSPRNPGKWYGRSRRKALEQVVRNLQGNCTRDAWLFAKDVFARVESDDLDLLVEHLDRNLQVREHADIVENVVEAMGRAADPRLAPALLRALDHSKSGVQNKVMQALVHSGDRETVSRAWFKLPQIETKGQNGWIRAAAAQLGSEAVERFRVLLSDPRFAAAHKTVVKQTLEMPPADALAVFSIYDGKVPADLQTSVAGLRHATGDAAGTALLHEFLAHEAPQVRISAIGGLRFGRKGVLLDRLLERTGDPDPEVRLAAVEMLRDVPGDNVSDALENLVIDESMPVRQLALQVLGERGRRAALDDLIEIVSSGTGSRVNLAVSDLISARDGAAVPAMAERLRAAPVDEKRRWVQGIALTTRPEAFEPLWEAFVADGTPWDSLRDYVAYLFLNLRGSELQLVERFGALPKSDYHRRGLLVPTLAGLAIDRADAEIAGAVFAALRAVLQDRTEIPQMRLSALEYLRRDLSLDDASAIRRMLADEQPPMRKALSDFLYEFF